MNDRDDASIAPDDDDLYEDSDYYDGVVPHRDLGPPAEPAPDITSGSPGTPPVDITETIIDLGPGMTIPPGFVLHHSMSTLTETHTELMFGPIENVPRAPESDPGECEVCEFGTDVEVVELSGTVGSEEWSQMVPMCADCRADLGHNAGTPTYHQLLGAATDQARRLAAELREAGYTGVSRRADLKSGTKVSTDGNRTGQIIAVFRKNNSPWEAEYGRADVEVVVLLDRPRTGLGYLALAGDYAVEVQP